MKLLKGISLLAIFFLAGEPSYSQIPRSSKVFKQAFLTRINRLRETGCKCGITYMRPAPPLVWNDQLESAAVGHARDMSKNNYFSHSSADGRTLKDRVFDVGYNFKGYQSYAIGENIACGQQSIDEVMNGWIKSEKHCKNLMNPAYREVGIAEKNSYWVQDFGGRVRFPPEKARSAR